MIEIIIQYFRVSRDISDPDYELLCQRQEEYNYCLQKNLEYPAVSKIHILLENEMDRQELENSLDTTHPKLNLFNLGKRMTFQDAFSYANKYLQNKLVIVLHSDIFLKAGFENLNPEKFQNIMLALARTNNMDGKNTGRGIRIKRIPGRIGFYCASLDGYLFKSPLPEKIVNMSNFYQNIWGSDNKMVYNFKTQGYQVYTPENLKMVHWHLTDIRPNHNHFWITRDNKLIPHNNGEFTKKYQKPNPHLVGGLIPIELGTSLMIKHF